MRIEKKHISSMKPHILANLPALLSRLVYMSTVEKTEGRYPNIQTWCSSDTRTGPLLLLNHNRQWVDLEEVSDNVIKLESTRWK